VGGVGGGVGVGGVSPPPHPKTQTPKPPIPNPQSPVNLFNKKLFKYIYIYELFLKSY